MLPLVEEPIDQYRLNDYRNKVADWIGRQGILFQLRYGGTVGSRPLFKRLLSLLVRGVFLLLILAVIGFFVLRSHYKTSTYQAKITDQVKEALGASEVTTNGLSRSSKSGKFRNLEIEGGERSFFYRAYLEGLSGAFSIFTGVTESWKPDALKITKADFQVKAGGGQEEMETSFTSLIKSLDGGGLNLIKIDDLSCNWGYSQLTYGSIENTDFRATLKDGGWDIEISGGSFRQNWLGPFSIRNGFFRVDETGLRVERLELVHEGGRLDLSGEIVGPMSKPKFDLSGAFTRLPVNRLVSLEGIKTRDYLEGTVSGELKIFGSSNQGIQMSGEVLLGEEDSITIRERWPLLRALSIIDSDRSYLRVGFQQGSFSFTTGGGGMQLKDLNLVSQESAKLVGEFSVGLPNQEEAAKALGITLTQNFASGHFSEDLTDTSSAQRLEDRKFSIRERTETGLEGAGVDIGDSMKEGIGKVDKKQLSAKELEGARLEQEMNTYRFSGDLKLAIPASAFDDNKTLSQFYPEDEEGWRWIPVVLKDTKFPAISEEANQELMVRGKERAQGTEEEE